VICLKPAAEIGFSWEENRLRHSLYRVSFRYVVR
jgi:hypothetical protein